jgi:hypothetical protein
MAWISDITVYIRKPDDPAFEWSSLGHFLCPAIEWKKQDGGYHLKAGPDISH